MMPNLSSHRRFVSLELPVLNTLDFGLLIAQGVFSMAVALLSPAISSVNKID